MTDENKKILTGGDLLVQALVNESFLTAFDTHTHTAPSGGGATTPPIIPSLPTHKTSKTKAE